MTEGLLNLGWVMACVGLSVSFLDVVYFGNGMSWLAVIYFLGCAVANSMLKSAYWRYREGQGSCS